MSLGKKSVSVLVECEINKNLTELMHRDNLRDLISRKKVKVSEGSFGRWLRRKFGSNAPSIEDENRMFRIMLKMPVFYDPEKDKDGFAGGLISIKDPEFNDLVKEYEQRGVDTGAAIRDRINAGEMGMPQVNTMLYSPENFSAFIKMGPNKYFPDIPKISDITKSIKSLIDNSTVMRLPDVGNIYKHEYGKRLIKKISDETVKGLLTILRNNILKGLKEQPNNVSFTPQDNVGTENTQSSNTEQATEQVNNIVPQTDNNVEVPAVADEEERPKITLLDKDRAPLTKLLGRINSNAMQLSKLAKAIENNKLKMTKTELIKRQVKYSVAINKDIEEAEKMISVLNRTRDFYDEDSQEFIDRTYRYLRANINSAYWSDTKIANFTKTKKMLNKKMENTIASNIKIALSLLEQSGSIQDQVSSELQNQNDATSPQSIGGIEEISDLNTPSEQPQDMANQLEEPQLPPQELGLSFAEPKEEPTVEESPNKDYTKKEVTKAVKDAIKGEFSQLKQNAKNALGWPKKAALHAIDVTMDKSQKDILKRIKVNLKKENKELNMKEKLLGMLKECAVLEAKLKKSSDKKKDDKKKKKGCAGKSHCSSKKKKIKECGTMSALFPSTGFDFSEKKSDKSKERKKTDDWLFGKKASDKKARKSK